MFKMQYGNAKYTPLAVAFRFKTSCRSFVETSRHAYRNINALTYDNSCIFSLYYQLCFGKRTMSLRMYVRTYVYERTKVRTLPLSGTFDVQIITLRYHNDST